MRRLVPALCAALLAAVVAAPPAASAPPAAAQPAAVLASTGTAAPDFATEVFADPWDFSNGDDVLLDHGPTSGLQGAAVRDGRLSFTMAAPGYLSPLWGGYPGALYLGREGGAAHNRLDAGRFTRFSLHAFASTDTPAGITWFTCEGLDPACQGGQPFLLKAGWHTYDLALANHPGYRLPQPWAGSVTGLRLALSPAGPTSFSLDWMRAYAPSGSARVEAAGGSWDVDDDPSDNRPDAPGHGPLACAGSCDLSLLPAGGYTVGGTPVQLRRPARPVLLDPDAVGGLDHATAAGNRWDFDGPADVASTGNLSVLGHGDRLSAVNAGPTVNDPFVWLRLPGGPIDSGRFHRLSVTSSYEGAFDLRDAPGGGSHGRVVWQRADQPPGTVVQTKEWVTYAGTRRLTHDLHAPGVHEDDVGNQLPWASSAVTGLRWDPNEDRGPRRWTLDRVALRADDEAGSSFAVRWYDAGFAPGSTVSLFADTDPGGYDGAPIATGLPQTPGTNVHVWDTRGVPLGTYWVYAVVDGPAGSGRAYSTGPVRVDHRIAGQSPSPATPLTRDLGDACPQSRVPGGAFSDVPASVHALAVDCVGWWGVSRGNGAGAFLPDATVTRGQMATFLTEVIARAGGTLPASAPDAFRDDDGTTHEKRIDQLAALGVVGGYGDGTYRPGAPVNRDQMASFLSRSYEKAAGRALAAPADYFTDDDGSTHEPSIDRVAGAGVAGGVGEDRYAPAGGVRRAQMASFLARLLDLLVAGGHGAPPAR